MLAKDEDQGAHTLLTRVGARPLGTPPTSWAPLELHQPQLQLYVFTFREKKIREEDSSRFTIRSRRQALISLGRADLDTTKKRHIRDILGRTKKNYFIHMTLL